jgi:hypothetical protein
MALGEKLPKEYDGPKIEGIIETLERKVSNNERKSQKSLQDLSKEVSDKITQVEQELTDKIEAGEKEDDSFPTTLPIPLNLKVFEAIVFGFAHVDAFQRARYFGKLVSYEFYGSPNSFENTNFNLQPQEAPYTQVGTHRGTGTVGSPDSYLDTEHPTDDTLTWVLDNRLFNPLWVGLLIEKRLIIQNITRSTNGTCDDTVAFKIKDVDGDFLNKNIDTSYMYAHNLKDNKSVNWTRVTAIDDSGTLTVAEDIFEAGDNYTVGYGRIGNYRLGNARYEIQAQGVEWVEGDEWRITEYPQNKQFSIGAFCTFTKRLGSFYVKARSVGKGKSYSPFTEEAESEGISSGGSLPAPRIVPPIHASPEPTDDGAGVECSMSGGFPVCPNHGALTWDDPYITGGTREINHWSFFGIEKSVFELVYEELEGLDGPVFYKVDREVAGENTEGDVS